MIDEVVAQLGSLWEISRCKLFLAYMSDVYGEHTNKLPHFRRLYIAEAVDGNISEGTLDPDINCWWAVDEEGVQEIRFPRFINDEENKGLFFATPLRKFFVTGNEILVYERLGNCYASMRKGNLEKTAEGLKINLTFVIWV